MRATNRNDLWISGHDMEMLPGILPNINGVSATTPGLLAFHAFNRVFSGSQAIILRNTNNGTIEYLQMGA